MWLIQYERKGVIDARRIEGVSRNEDDRLIFWTGAYTNNWYLVDKEFEDRFINNILAINDCPIGGISNILSSNKSEDKE